jgi:hypothetical protein
MKRLIWLTLCISILHQYLSTEEKWVRTRLRGRPKDDEIHTKGMG